MAGAAIGSVVAGWLATRHSGALPPARFFVFGAALSIAGILYLPPLPYVSATFLHIVFGFFLGGSVLAFAIVGTHCSMKTQGTAIGFVTTLGYAGGALLQSAIGEQLGKTPEPDAADYIRSFWIFPGALVLASLIALKLRMGPVPETEKGENDAHR